MKIGEPSEDMQNRWSSGNCRWVERRNPELFDASTCGMKRSGKQL
jgi:hypothetical protein